MSEGLTQSHRTINIETLPRITPKSTSKITSPDYAHDFTDVAVGKSAEPISPPPPSRKCRKLCWKRWCGLSSERLSTKKISGGRVCFFLRHLRPVRRSIQLRFRLFVLLHQSIHSIIIQWFEITH